MSNFVITIARQYGSGGRTIGQMLSQKLGIPFYDRNIIKMISEEAGVHEGLFGRVDEYDSAKAPLFKKSSIYTGKVLTPEDKDFTSDENLFALQAQYIENLAKKESCVIIGRCSNYILRKEPHVLRVFIHAPHEFRMEKSREKIGGGEKEIERFLLKDDRRKRDFSRRFTGWEWEDARGYDMCLNTGKLTYDNCVDAIIYRLNLDKQESSDRD